MLEPRSLEPVSGELLRQCTPLHDPARKSHPNTGNCDFRRKSARHVAYNVNVCTKRGLIPLNARRYKCQRRGSPTPGSTGKSQPVAQRGVILCREDALGARRCRIPCRSPHCRFAARATLPTEHPAYTSGSVQPLILSRLGPEKEPV